MRKQKPIHGAGPPGKPLLPLEAEVEILEKLGADLRIGSGEIAAILKKHGVEADVERLQDSYRKRLGQRLMASIRDEEGRREVLARGSEYIVVECCSDQQALKAIRHRIHKATLHPASFVYGNSRSAGSYLYVCDRYPACNSYVAAHRATRQPMGSLADGELRHKRIQAHRAFDRLWRSGLMTKKEAYQWMQTEFGLHEEQAHIAQFGAYMCDRLICACEKFRIHSAEVA